MTKSEANEPIPGRWDEKLGNTDLPEAQPDLSAPQDVTLETLKLLHHVLLEVRFFTPFFVGFRDEEADGAQ